MVNYGVSRGCEECKKRRKKCDKVRPACSRCLKGRRACPGYKSEASLIFRHWSQPQASYPSPVCLWSPEVDDDEFEKSSLSIFIAEFVLQPVDRQLSRGFLDGMQLLLSGANPSPALASAAKILVLASIGNRMGRKSLISKTERQYVEILRTYHQSLSTETKYVSVENLYTAVLLGLYEITISSELSSIQAHVRGVCAILSSHSSPFDLTASRSHVFQLGNPLFLKPPLKGGGAFSWPPDNGFAQNLDSMTVKFQDFFHRAGILLMQEDPLPKECRGLQEEALALDEEFSLWGKFLSHHGAPPMRTTIAALDEPAAILSKCAYCHSGAVDRYFDYYIAAVWNTYRKSHVMLLDIMAHLARHLIQEEMLLDLQRRAQTIVSDIIASIPYHLAFDVKEYLSLVQTRASFISPNRPIGGLLLLHPLYESAKCYIIPRDVRLYFIRCLTWIGEHMGIGQASLLARCINSRMDDVHPLCDPEFPFQGMSEGHVLIWAGMLLQPTCLKGNQRVI